MSDLIGRSELIKEIEKYKFGAISNDAEREYVKDTILNFIICQPTAYDIGKVIEELEKSKRKLFSFANDYSEVGDFEMAEIYSQLASEYTIAIEIVKQGCVGKEVEQMRADRIVRRVDDLGRIIIPKEIRRNLGIKESDPMEIFMDGDNIVLRKYEENVDDVCE